MKSEEPIQVLLEKFLRNQCSQEETDRVVTYFQEQQLSSNFPTVEDVFELLEEAPEMDRETADRIYKKIQLQKQFSKASKPSVFQKGYRYAVAAIFIGVLIGGYFSRDYFLTLEPKPSDFQQNNYITLQLENGEIEYISENDSTIVKDKDGVILGSQRGDQLIYTGKTATTENYNTLKVPYGKRFELSLSDGTRVYLNAGTTLKYPVNFIEGKNRTVYLTGEAFFEVAKDLAHPFVVSTNRAKIQVLGTKFNVDSYENQSTTTVVLVEGSVLVEDEKQDSIKMFPNEKVAVGAEGMEKETVVAESYASWKNGFLTFQDKKIKELIPLLERYYNIEIYCENYIELNNETSSGKIYLSPKISNVIETLSIITHNRFHYRKK